MIVRLTPQYFINIERDKLVHRQLVYSIFVPGMQNACVTFHACKQSVDTITLIQHYSHSEQAIKVEKDTLTVQKQTPRHQ